MLGRQHRRPMLERRPRDGRLTHLCDDIPAHCATAARSDHDDYQHAAEGDRPANRPETEAWLYLPTDAHERCLPLLCHLLSGTLLAAAAVLRAPTANSSIRADGEGSELDAVAFCESYCLQPGTT